MAQEGARSDGGDLAAQLTRRVEEVVELIRDRSLRPILTVVGVIFSALAGVVIAAAVLVALVVGLTHLINHDVFRGRVWAGDFLIGGILAFAGLFLLRISVRSRNAGE